MTALRVQNIPGCEVADYLISCFNRARTDWERRLCLELLRVHFDGCGCGVVVEGEIVKMEAR